MGQAETEKEELMIDSDLANVVRDAVARVLDGRETVPGDLPYPPQINEYILATARPDMDPRRMAMTKDGRALTRAARQVYVAGYLAGRECDAQISRQLRATFGTGPHPYVGVAVCLVCDQAPDHPAHREPVPCTGLTARWCPVHGDCTCPREPDGDGHMDDPRCPLHAPTSDHAEVASHG